MSAAKEAILGSIRSALEGVPALPPTELGAPAPGTPPGLGSMEERLAHFRGALDALKATVLDASDVSDAGRHLERILAERRVADAPRVAVSDGPLARAVVAGIDGLDSANDVVPWNAPRERLLAAPVGVTEAQAGIAETGTLVLLSAEEHHRLVSLLPPTHVAILRASAILATLGDALSRSSGANGPGSRTVTQITGPSRTADIELEIVVGVHGPKELFVILIADTD